MDYFEILNLKKEPFSNSPDPEFFYDARPHVECLQKLELSLRLRRGLSVVTGEVGTGKTTLCRHLIRKFAGDDMVETHLVLDPSFSSPLEFLRNVAEMFCPAQLSNDLSNWQLKEIIKKYLFHQGVDKKRLVILIVDEGQKLPLYCLEILREFLNYETNEYKLLQIVIFAQREFEKDLKKYQNLADRMSMYHLLIPLNFRETSSMIRFRIAQAGRRKAKNTLFTYPALWAIYRASEGYPRRIINLSHQVLLTIIVQNRSRAGWFTARSCEKRGLERRTKTWRPMKWVVICLLVLAVLFGLTASKLNIFKFQDMLNKASLPLVIKHKIRVRPVETGKVESVESEVQPACETAAKTTKAPVETLDGYSEKPLTSRKEPPGVLGYITVAEGETLIQMVRDVYGVYNKKLLKSVCSINESIKNSDLLKFGQPIIFPSIRVKPVQQALIEPCWVQIAEKESLQNAHLFLTSPPEGFPPMRMIPCWNSAEGLRFHIVLKKIFADEEAAQKSLKALPTELAVGMKILSNWGADTVFFADPFE